MRFDEFVEKNGVSLSAVDRFAGFVVEVGVPPAWEPFDSAVGLRVWVCRNDPHAEEFCGNAVLTMHRVEASLDVGEVFTMLADQQLQSVPACHELHRELAAATEGAGVAGALTMEITHELGTIDSVSRSRIITAEQETLIAQLTVTALHNSPVDRAHVWLTVRLNAGASSVCDAPVTGAVH
jgi:Probable lipoprotein LpqN